MKSEEIKKKNQELEKWIKEFIDKHYLALKALSKK